MHQPHKHRMAVHSFAKQNPNVIYFSCKHCRFMTGFSRAYFYNTIWKEGIRND